MTVWLDDRKFSISQEHPLCWHAMVTAAVSPISSCGDRPPVDFMVEPLLGLGCNATSLCSHYHWGMDCVCSVVGLKEIAELLGVAARTPHTWAHRGVLPPPDHSSINGYRAWDRATIIAWAAETDRLPDCLRKEL